MENSLENENIKLRSDTCKRRSSIFFMGMMIMMFKLQITQQNSRTKNRRKKNQEQKLVEQKQTTEKKSKLKNSKHTTKTKREQS
jgi:hypothetical protein